LFEFFLDHEVMDRKTLQCVGNFYETLQGQVRSWQKITWDVMLHLSN